MINNLKMQNTLKSFFSHAPCVNLLVTKQCNFENLQKTLIQVHQNQWQLCFDYIVKIIQILFLCDQITELYLAFPEQNDVLDSCAQTIKPLIQASFDFFLQSKYWDVGKWQGQSAGHRERWPSLCLHVSVSDYKRTEIIAV